MTFATEIEKQNSARFVLIRITPARHVSTDLASAGGGIYTMTFNYPIAKVERNGTVLTETSTNPPGSNDQWYHDETTGTFKIKLASAPSATTNVIVIFFYLFYSNGPTKACETPTDTTTTVRHWEPRLTQLPRIAQDFSNIINGILTIAPTSFAISNVDRQFEDYLTIEDSFSRKSVDVWLCVSSLENIKKVYSGRITAISTGGDSVGFNVSDPLEALNQPAYFTFQNPHGYLLHSSNQAFQYEGERKPLHIVLGRTSPYTTRPIATSNGLSLLELIDGLPAYCRDLSATISVATNYHWNVGLIASAGDGIETQSYGSITRTTTNGSYRYIKFSALSANVAIGHTIAWNEGAPFYQAIVRYAGDFTYSGNSYNIVIDNTDPFTTSSTMATTTYAIAVGVKNYPSNGDITTLKQHEDFTWSGVDHNFKTNAPDLWLSGILTTHNPYIVRGIGAIGLNPQQHQMFYKVEKLDESETLTNAVLLGSLLQYAGLTINQASFDAVDSALPDRVNFCIPNIDENEHQTYLKYVQDILSSTLGYLFTNEDGEIEYHLLATPSSSDSRNENVVLAGSMQSDIDYKDIATELRFKNPHLVQSTYTPRESSARAQYLHGIINSVEYRHCMELNGSNELARQAEIFSILSERRCTYRWSTATKDANVAPGDDILLEHPAVVGGTASSQVKIVAVKQGPDSTEIEAQDLQQL